MFQRLMLVFIVETLYHIIPRRNKIVDVKEMLPPVASTSIGREIHHRPSRTGAQVNSQSGQEAQDNCVDRRQSN